MVERWQAPLSLMTRSTLMPWRHSTRRPPLHADQAAGDEPAQELAPKRFGFGFADVESDDFAPSGLVHGVRDDDALTADAAAVTHLLDLRVDEQIRVAALQRPLPERLHLLIRKTTLERQTNSGVRRLQPSCSPPMTVVFSNIQLIATDPVTGEVLATFRP